MNTTDHVFEETHIAGQSRCVAETLTALRHLVSNFGGPAQADSSPSDQSQRPSAAWRLHLNQRSNRLARSLDPAKAYQTRATEPAVVAIFSPRAIRINALHHLVSNLSANGLRKAA